MLFEHLCPSLTLHGATEDEEEGDEGAAAPASAGAGQAPEEV